jgi:hypothetical protein
MPEQLDLCLRRQARALLSKAIRARLPAGAIAARLATTADHVLLAAERNPAPRLPAGSPALSPGPRPPADGQLPEPAGRKDRTRKADQPTGRSERAIDPHWLREQYHARQRSLKDIAAGITLLRITTGGTIALIADGEHFARNALATLTMAEPAHDSRHQPPSAPALG